MRKTFVVLAKLMGLYLLFFTTQYFFSLTMMLSIASGNATNSRFFMSIFFSLIGLCLLFVIIWTLIFRTDWLADKVRVPDEPLPNMNHQMVLRVGIILLGIYFLFGAFTALFNIATSAASFKELQGSHAMILRQIITTLFKVALGGWLTFRSDVVACLIDKSEKTNGVLVAGVVIGICLVLVILGETAYYFSNKSLNSTPLGCYKNRDFASSTPLSTDTQNSTSHFLRLNAPIPTEEISPTPTNPPVMIKHAYEIKI